jgi:hypothetical protein
MDAHDVDHRSQGSVTGYAENMRVRAEIDPLLLLSGVMSLYAISRGSQKRADDSISVT